MPPYSADEADRTEEDLKDCARCHHVQPLADISEVRLRVGGYAVYICKRCKKREEEAPVALGYECPGWRYGKHGYRSSRLSFRAEDPSVQKLVGEYDLIFYAADQSFGPRYHRKTRGTLRMYLKEDVGDGGAWGRLLLCGSVSMDPSVAISDTPWIDSFNFVQVSDDDLSTPTLFPGFEEGGFLPYAGTESCSIRSSRSSAFRESAQAAESPQMYGQLRIISQRSVVRSRPDAKAVSKRAHSPVIFSSMREADEIMAKYKDSITRWLTSNLGLPDLAASLICEYWCTRPSPLFYFLEGDLCLTSLMPRKGFMYDDVTTLMVARRRWLE